MKKKTIIGKSYLQRLRGVLSNDPAYKEAIMKEEYKLNFKEKGFLTLTLISK